MSRKFKRSSGAGADIIKTEILNFARFDLA